MISKSCKFGGNSKVSILRIAVSERRFCCADFPLFQHILENTVNWSLYNLCASIVRNRLRENVGGKFFR